MRLLLGVAVLLLTGCATRGELAAVRLEQRGLILDASVKHVEMLDRDSDTLGQLDALDRRVKGLEERLRGEWDRDECENYKPEAQKLFCRRKPMAVDKSFEDLADEVTRKVDALFCAKATEKWQKKAFCGGGQ